MTRKKMIYIGIAFALVLLAILLSLFIPILLNRAPLLDEPGFAARLSIYLGSNVAETSTDHAFPELRPRTFSGSAETAKSRVLSCVESLGWNVVSNDDNRIIQVEITTPLWKHVDDMAIELQEKNGETVLSIRSASRVGKGDLGANVGHILKLSQALGSS